MPTLSEMVEYIKTTWGVESSIAFHGKVLHVRLQSWADDTTKQAIIDYCNLQGYDRVNLTMPTRPPVVETFTGDGSTKVFTMAEKYVFGSIELFVDGIKQYVGIDFKEYEDQQTIEFEKAPVSNALIKSKYVRTT